MELQHQFEHISDLIVQAKQNAYQAVNKELIPLYWQIGEFLYQQVEGGVWGQSIVIELSEYLRKVQPNVKGFSSQNL